MFKENGGIRDVVLTVDIAKDPSIIQARDEDEVMGAIILHQVLRSGECIIEIVCRDAVLDIVAGGSGQIETKNIQLRL